jgi:hypothetical protein
MTYINLSIHVYVNIYIYLYIGHAKVVLLNIYRIDLHVEDRFLKPLVCNLSK